MSAERPTFTIVVPSFNQASWLEECLHSILSQTMLGDEVIVMDGGSTDGSVEILQREARYLTHWESERDAGQTAAIAAGMCRAKNEWLTWLNSDDVLLPGALAALRRFPLPSVDVVYGDHVVLDGDGSIVERHKHPPWARWVALRTSPYFAQPGTFFTKRIWDSVGGVDQTLHCVFDADLFLRFAEANARFGHIPLEVAGFRKHAEAKGASWKTTYASERAALLERHPTLRPTVSNVVARAALKTTQLLTGNYFWTAGWNMLLRGTPRNLAHPLAPEDARQQNTSRDKPAS